MIISNESINFKDPKESDDPQLFDDRLQWSLFLSNVGIQRLWTNVVIATDAIILILPSY